MVSWKSGYPRAADAGVGASVRGELRIRLRALRPEFFFTDAMFMPALLSPRARLNPRRSHPAIRRSVWPCHRACGGLTGWKELLPCRQKAIDDGREPEPGARSLGALIQDGHFDFSIEFQRTTRRNFDQSRLVHAIAEVQRIWASIETAARLGARVGGSAFLSRARLGWRLGRSSRKHGPIRPERRFLSIGWAV
jgi:hypothetical protein